MRKSTIQIEAAAIPKPESKPCPVAALAREAAIVIVREDTVDNESLRLANDAKRENHRMMQALYDQRKWLEEHASHLFATSGEGALFQLGILHSAARALDDCSDDQQEVAELMKLIDRIAYSLLAFIEASTGTKFDEICRDFYLPDRLNPYLQVSEAIGGMKEG